MTKHFRAGQKQTFQHCVFDTFSIAATLQNLRGEITAAIPTKFFHLKQKTNSLTPNVGAKGQAQAAHKMRSMRRLGLSSDRRERP
jgi:hypothetical protein